MEALTWEEKLDLKMLPESEKATYQALRARGVNHRDAIESALDGVTVEDARKVRER